MALSAEIKELVRSRTDLVGLIAESLTLVPRGPNFAALCPFHDDHNPSMMVYPDRQSFRCWSCNEGGDAFTWVMKRENLGFFEALKILAERAHIELPKSDFKVSDESRQKNDLYEVLKWAELKLHEYFLRSPDAEVARQYVKQQRGYSDETINTFKIGYHPADWEWFLRQAHRQFDAATLAQARLVKERDGSSGYYDYFVDRVLFPIHDERSRTVAFGGRIIPGRAATDAPKYFNSPESVVFQKSRILYGLPQARETIGKEKTVIVVEGYADCVACHQYGVKNVVATLGTALTEIQCTRLKAFAQKIVLVYDSDEPGQNAAARAVGMLIGQSVDLRVMNVPNGKDPDEFLKANGPERFKELVASAPEAWEFRLNWEIKKRGTDALSGREQILTEMLTLIAKVPKLEGTPREALILGRLASRFRISESEVRSQLERFRKTGSVKPNAAAPVSNNFYKGSNSYSAEVEPSVEELHVGEDIVAEFGGDEPTVTARGPRKIDFYRRTLGKDDKLESEIIEMLFARPQLAELLRMEIGPDDFLNRDLKELLLVILDVCELGEEPTFDRVMVQIEDPELKTLAVWVSDQGRMKGIEAKLSEMKNGVPSLFRVNIDHMKWRREERTHREELAREALRVDGPNADPFALLKKASEFHQKRAGIRKPE